MVLFYMWPAHLLFLLFYFKEKEALQDMSWKWTGVARTAKQSTQNWQLGILCFYC